LRSLYSQAVRARRVIEHWCIGVDAENVK
jgi:hypothetical protein